MSTHQEEPEGLRVLSDWEPDVRDVTWVSQGQVSCASVRAGVEGAWGFSEEWVTWLLSVSGQGSKEVCGDLRPW
jgi:hypothetical protein